MIEQFQWIDGCCGVGWYQNIYLTAWWDDATVPRLEALRLHRNQFISQQTGPLYSISLLYQTKLKIIPKEVRKTIEQINLEGGDRFAAEAYFVKVGGLLLSSMRFLLTGIRLINKTKAPLEVFNDVGEAAKWISSHNKLESKNVMEATEQFLGLCGK